MLAPPATYNQRDDLLEVTILDAINLPTRKDGSPRQPFFSAQIPNTEQRWQQSSPLVESGRSSHPFNQTFFLSVAERLDHSIRLSLWDRKPAVSDKDGGADHHDKLLGECGLPLPYIGWQWVDAKMKLKPADAAHDSDIALTYVRAKLRLTKDFKSGRSGEMPSVEEVEEEATSPRGKNGSGTERKLFWRHTRDLGKRSPSADRKSEFVMSAEIRTVGGREDADSIDRPARTARQELLLSQPVRTISINASDSSSDDSEDDRPSAKSGSGLTRRLSRDLTKLRQLLTYEDRGSTRESPSKGSPGKKFWTIGRQSEASLEVSQSADSLPSVRSIDWRPNGSAQSRTFSDGEMPASSTVSKKNKKGKGTLTKKEKKKKEKKEKEEKEGTSTSTSGSSESVKKVKVKKAEKKNRNRSKSKKGGDMDEIEREESWERDDSGRHHQQKHLRSQEGMESGAGLAVIEEESPGAGTDEDSEAVASADGSPATGSPEDGGLRQMKPKKGKEERAGSKRESVGEAKKKNKKESKKSTSSATP